MIINKAFKVELDPNQKQRVMFDKCCAAARKVFNWALDDHNLQYEWGLTPNIFEQKRRFNSLKYADIPWVTEVPYTVTAQEFDNIKRAFDNFFRRVKAGEKPGYPRFKSRLKDKQSFALRGNFHVEDRRIKLPCIGWVRLAEAGYVPLVGVKILSVNVSGRAGKWFASMQVEQEVADPEPAINDPVGVDVGIKSLAVCSDGKTFENPRALKMAEAKLARLQRELCRREKGSANRAKTKEKIAKLHYRIACVRQHALHQVSHYVTAETKPSVVVIEDLNVKGMVQNHCLAKAVSDASMSELHRQIEYKSGWNGVQVQKANRWFPSSKLCGKCGTIKETLTLSDRVFVCDACGYTEDRDLNAAKNLRSLAQ